MRVEPLGDLDGDGRSELALVSSPRAEEPTDGELRLMSSRTPRATVADLVEITAPVAGGQRRVDVAALGDLDGDGLGEIAVLLGLFGGTQRTTVAILPGSAIPTAGPLSVTGFVLVEDDSTYPPNGLDACDLDGDGLPELITSTGIWSGADLLTPGAPPNADGVQPPLVCLGDIDGNETSEMARGDSFLE